MLRKSLACVAFALLFGCGGSSVSGLATQALMSQIGGKDSLSGLAGSFLSSSAKDSRLSGLMGGADVNAVQPKLTNQLCSMLGGGCQAPLSEDQIAQSAKKVTPEQNAALKENFGSSLGGMNLSPSLQGAVTKAIAPKLGGIVAGLL
jgi:hypothetical protein